MPEGDTVHKLSRVIEKVLLDQVLTECLVRGVYGSERLAGAKVLRIEPLGKHLLIHFDRDLQLRVHLGMRGTWHRYKHGERWKRAASTASVVLKTANTVLVCFNALDIELFPTAQRKWKRKLEGLGPDLLAYDEPNWNLVLKNLERHHKGDSPLGEVLLDQRVAAGLGNVYKSEIAFMGALVDDPFKPADDGYSPWQPVGQVPAEKLVGMFSRGRCLLQANLGGWFRTTRVDRRQQKAPKDGILFVYGRVGEKCLRCGGEIERGFQGLQNRVTYWCPSCQRM